MLLLKEFLVPTVHTMVRVAEYMDKIHLRE